MTTTVIDIETTNFFNNPSPYIPDNYLVSVGYRRTLDSKWSNTEYLFFKHSKKEPTPNGSRILQDCLWNTDLLVGHNIKFDLSWLLECGFEYENEVYDTMIFEYVKAGGKKKKLDLSSCCDRRNIPIKLDVVKEYLKNGLGFETIPFEIVEEYGINDVNITCELYEKQKEELNEEYN